MKSHQKLVHHENSKDMKCDICHIEVNTPSNLKSHMKEVHEKSRNFECDFCKKAFVSNNHFKSYLKLVHLNGEKYLNVDE